MQGRAKLHEVLDEQEDKVRNSTFAQQLTALKEKLGEIMAHLQAEND